MPAKGCKAEDFISLLQAMVLIGSSQLGMAEVGLKVQEQKKGSA